MPSLVGNKPNQVPTNGDLGTLAFQDSSNVKVGVLNVDTGTAGAPALTTTGDTNTGIFFPAADTIAFSEGGTERMRIDSAGNVGIDTSNPIYRLQVGNATTTSTLGVIPDGTNGTALRWGGTGAGAGVLRFLGQSDTERMRIDSAGNVGLGVTPSAWGGTNKGVEVFNGLGLSSSSSLIAGYSQNAYNNGTNWIYRFTNPASLYLQSSGTHSWRIAPSGTAGNAITFTQAMTLDASGNLLKGTTTAGGIGWSLYEVSPNPYIISNTSSTSRIHYYFQYNSTTVGQISTTTTATTYSTSSDYRLKENIAPMTGALDTVAQLKPVTYSWKEDGSDGQGFIAHELAEVVPDCVTGEKDATEEQEYEISPAIPAVLDEEGNEVTPAVEAVMGTRTVPVYQGIDTSFLVATLTAAIQEQQAMIEELKAKVAALEAA